MPYPSDPRLQALHHRLQGCRSRQEKGDLEGAAREFAAVRALAEPLGVRSAYLLFSQADVELDRDNPEAALGFLIEAAVVEPIHPAIQGHFVQACDRLRAAVLHGDDLEVVKRLYALLSRVGETDVPSHLAFAMALQATGEVTSASSLVDALVLLAPASADVWRAHALFAAARGDTEGAARSTAEAEARANGTQPYGIPSPRARC